MLCILTPVFLRAVLRISCLDRTILSLLHGDHQPFRISCPKRLLYRPTQVRVQCMSKVLVMHSIHILIWGVWLAWMEINIAKFVLNLIEINLLFLHTISLCWSILLIFYQLVISCRSRCCLMLIFLCRLKISLIATKLLLFFLLAGKHAHLPFNLFLLLFLLFDYLSIFSPCHSILTLGMLRFIHKDQFIIFLSAVVVLFF